MVMRKTIKKARCRTMQTEINGTFRSMKNSSLNLANSHWRVKLHFPKFTSTRGAFHSIKLNFRCEFPEISMGEWYRVFQCEKRQAGIFQWFLGVNGKQDTEMSTSWLFIDHNSRDLTQTTTAVKMLQNKGFNESYTRSKSLYISQPECAKKKTRKLRGHFL